MSKRMRVALVVAAVVATVAGNGAAQTDEDKSTARKLFFDAKAALDTRDFTRAAELFERSNAIYPAPTSALGLARSLAGAGKLVRAYEVYSSMLAQALPAGAPDRFEKAIADANTERAALEPRLPGLVIRVLGPTDPVVSVDGHRLPAAALGVKRLVETGAHVVEAGGAGYRAEVRRASVAEGETREMAFELRAAPTASKALSPPGPERRAASPGSGTRVAGFIVGGFGVASLIASAVSGGLYLSKKSIVDDGCVEVGSGEFECTDASGPDAASAAHTLGVVNAITLGVGVVATGVGVTLVLMGTGGEHVALRASPGRVTLEGGF